MCICFHFNRARDDTNVFKTPNHLPCKYKTVTMINRNWNNVRHSDKIQESKSNKENKYKFKFHISTTTTFSFLETL